MKVTIEELEAYLLDHYSNGGIDQSLFMKLSRGWRRSDEQTAYRVQGLFSLHCS